MLHLSKRWERLHKSIISSQAIKKVSDELGFVWSKTATAENKAV